MIRLARVAAVGVGAGVLAWQVVNAVQGRFVHAFLIPDLVIAPILIGAALCPADRWAAPVLLAGFAAMAGVFLAAATGRLISGRQLDPGTWMTTVGLVPCLACALGLGRWLGQQTR